MSKLYDIENIIKSKNKQIIDTKKEEASKQVDEYIKEENIIKATDKEIRKLIVVTLGKRYVEYEFVKWFHLWSKNNNIGFWLKIK